MSELVPGSIFAERYRIERLIAVGGMGSVYEVVHLETERRRALKVMLASMVTSADLRERFKREARVAAHVESDYIVDVFDAGFDEGTQMPFLVMELLRGEEVAKRVEKHGALSSTETVSLLHQTSLALDKTHRANIIHRDLKPENLFLCDRDDGPPRIKVLDFGIAKILEGGQTKGATQTLGTPLYMAPEQFRGEGRLSGAADVYALGMIAFFMLTGYSYWDQEANEETSVYAFAVTVMQGPRVSAVERAKKSWNVTLPAGFDPWFKKCCALDPAERFQRASDAVFALADVLGVPRPALSSSQTGPYVPQGDFNLGSSQEVPTFQRTGSLVSADSSKRSSVGKMAAVGLLVGALGFAGAKILIPKSEGQASEQSSSALAAAPAAAAPIAPENTASAPAGAPQPGAALSATVQAPVGAGAKADKAERPAGTAGVLGAPGGTGAGSLEAGLAPVSTLKPTGGSTKAASTKSGPKTSTPKPASEAAPKPAVTKPATLYGRD